MIRFTNVNKIYDNGTHAIKGVSFLVDNGSSSSWSAPPAPASPPS